MRYKKQGPSLNLVLKEFNSYEEFQKKTEASRVAFEEGAKEAQAELGSGFSSKLEGFFNSIGIVDPCDLVRKDRKKIEGEVATLEAIQDELNRANAQNLHDRLSSVSGLLGAFGAGSMAYWGYKEYGDEVRGVFDNIDKIQKTTAGLAGSAEEVRDKVQNTVKQAADQLGIDQSDVDKATDVAGKLIDRAKAALGETYVHEAGLTQILNEKGFGGDYATPSVAARRDVETAKRFNMDLDYDDMRDAYVIDGEDFKKAAKQTAAGAVAVAKAAPEIAKLGLQIAPVTGTIFGIFDLISDVRRITGDGRELSKQDIVDLTISTLGAIPIGGPLAKVFKSGSKAAKVRAMGGGVGDALKAYGKQRVKGVVQRGSKFMDAFADQPLIMKALSEEAPDIVAFMKMMDSTPMLMVRNARIIGANTGAEILKSAGHSKGGAFTPAMNALIGDKVDNKEGSVAMDAWSAVLDSVGLDDKELTPAEVAGSSMPKSVKAAGAAAAAAAGGANAGELIRKAQKEREEQRATAAAALDTDLTSSHDAFKTIGKVAMVTGGLLFAYKKLLDMAPGAACSIKEFIKDIASGIGSALKTAYDYTVGPIVDAISKFLDEIWGTIFEDNKSRHRIRQRWMLIERSALALSNDIKLGIATGPKSLDRILLGEALILEQTKGSSKGGLDPKAIKAAEQMVAQSSKDAFDLFMAMKGLGTNTKVVEDVIGKRYKAGTLPGLYKEYDVLLKDIDQQRKGFSGALKSAGPAALAASGLFAMAVLNSKSNKAPTPIAGMGAGKEVGEVGNAIAGIAQVPGFVQAAKPGSAVADKTIDDLEISVSDSDWAMSDTRNWQDLLPPGAIRNESMAYYQRPLTEILGMGAALAGFLPALGPIGAAAGTALTVGSLAGMVGKGASDIVKAFTDKIGLQDDLITWLEEDGLEDEAELVSKALVDAGIKRNDRGY